MTEITRLGFTTSTLERLFKSKGAALSKYEATFKTSFWMNFKTILYKIEGFKTGMEKKVHDFIMSSTDISKLTSELEQYMITTFSFTSTQITTFHYYF